MSLLQSILHGLVSALLGVALVVALCWAVYTVLVTRFRPAPVPVVTEVVYEQMTAPPMEPEPTKPHVRYVYLSRTDTVTVAVPLPIGLVPYYVTEREPVVVRGRDVTFTVWQPDSLRYERLVYSTSRPRWGGGIDAVATLTGGGQTSLLVGPGLRLRRGGLHLTAAAGPDLLQGGGAWQVGLRYELTGSE